MDIYLVIPCMAMCVLLVAWICLERKWKREERRQRQVKMREEPKPAPTPAREEAEPTQHKEQLPQSPEQGERSERELLETLRQTDIPRQVIFHDLLVKKRNGGYAQIDLLVALPTGIVVFEVKEYSGKISGKAHHQEWKQELSEENRYIFYNPVKQNGSHIKALRWQLGRFGQIPFYSVVVFYGSCELTDIGPLPADTFVVKAGQVLECVAAIRKNAPARYADIKGMIEALKQAMHDGRDEQRREQHLKQAVRTKKMYGARPSAVSTF